jgi:hypothetical protein
MIYCNEIWCIENQEKLSDNDFVYIARLKESLSDLQHCLIHYKSGLYVKSAVEEC